VTRTRWEKAPEDALIYAMKNKGRPIPAFTHADRYSKAVFVSTRLVSRVQSSPPPKFCGRNTDELIKSLKSPIDLQLLVDRSHRICCPPPQSKTYHNTAVAYLKSYS